MRAAIGFTPHSGWAAVVVVGGDVANPQVLRRDRIEMADRRLSGSKQPYHAIAELPLPEAERRLARLCESATEMAHDAIRVLLEDIRVKDVAPRVAGIIDSSGRKGGTLAAILASHPLIHAADGDHFRDALAAGCTRCGLAVVRVRQRDLTERAAAVLRRSPEQLQASVKDLGRPLGPPWGADEKAATLLGWLLLGEKAEPNRRA